MLYHNKKQIIQKNKLNNSYFTKELSQQNKTLLNSFPELFNLLT